MPQRPSSLEHWLVILAATWGLTLSTIAVAEGNPPETLSVYTWEQYMDPAVVEEFEQANNVKVSFSYFDSDETRNYQMSANAGRGYDIVLLTGIDIHKYVKRGWLEPVDKHLVSNTRHLEPRWSQAFEDAEDYSVAYFWGTLGVGYRRDLYPQGFPSWSDLLEPEDVLHGKIMMSNFNRQLVALSLKAGGHSVNTTDKALINEAGSRLLEQKPFVRAYGYPSLSEDSSFLTGEIWAGPMYSGDVLMLQQYDSNVDYQIPAEGGLIWADYLAVTSVSNAKDLAFRFINFLNEPEIAARQAEYVYYATPNIAARELLPESFLSHPVIYPSQDILDRSEFLTPIPARAKKRINAIGSRLVFK